MELPLKTAKELVAQHYDLQAEALALNGYDELNFLLACADGKKYLLKVASDDHSVHLLNAQMEMLAHLSVTSIAHKFQSCLPNRKGELLTRVMLSGKCYYVRVLSFLDGTFWACAGPHNSEQYKSLGNVLGTMDRALQAFDHPAMHRHYCWDISTAADASWKLQYIQTAEQRRIAAYFLLQFETEVQPVLSSLRHACVHNDANDYNVLVTGNEVVGLIDFGDAVYTALINNLAIACTYAMLDAADPLAAAALVVKGYHEAFPLLEAETDLLYYLIAARLCISVTQSAYNASLNSNNEHHFITEKPAWSLLHRLLEVNVIKAQHSFREACGFAPLIDEKDDCHDLLTMRKELIGRNLSISYKKPLKIVRGALQYLYDNKGRTFVDCVNNVSHVGHCHPTVVRALQKQAARLNTNTRYLHDNLVAYAQMLRDTLPESLSVFYFTNSGSEANDLAIRVSRHFTGQKDVIVLDHAYHGTSTTAMELSPYKFDGRGGKGKMAYIHKAQNPDLYRGPFRYGDNRAGEKYAADVARIIAQLHQNGKAPAAFICETLLGVGGQIPLPPHYLRDVYRHVRAAGGICIADEVQVGFGRVGDKFWGFELQDVVPDMVVLGKPIGNGHPLAAVAMTPELAEAFDNGMEYFNTYGGNPVSMAVGMAVIQTIQEEGMQQHAQETGAYLLQKLKGLEPRHQLIGDVRGHGLFIGVELVRDRITLEPAVPEIDWVVEAMKEQGFLLSTDGPYHNVLKIKPPLVFSRQNADNMVQALDAVLATIPG